MSRRPLRNGFVFPVLLLVLAGTTGRVDAQRRFDRVSEGVGGGRTTRLGTDNFARLHSDWQSLDEQLGIITRQVRGSTLADQDSLRRQYVVLVDRALELLSDLRAAALDEYHAYPNEDSEVTKTILGILAHEVRSDATESAMELVSELLDHNCDHISFYNLAGRASYCAHEFGWAQELLLRARELNAIEKQGDDYLKGLDTVRGRWKDESQIRHREETDDNLPRVRLETTKGDIVLELFENEAPQTVGNFVHLVESGFYDGLTFHRVVANLMAQSGSPKGDGYGGPGYSILDETGRADHRNHCRGSLTMAKTKEPNSASSQFFITFRPVPELDGKHTVFGRVLEGMPVVASLQRREFNSRSEPDRIVRAEVIRKRDHDYKPTKSRP